MQEEFDPFDPEEIRRRQMLDIIGQNSQNDAGEPDMSGIMGPDEEELPASQTESSIPTVGVNRSTPVQMTDAQRHYQQTLSQMPSQADYRPSRGRTVLNAIAGGLAGAAGGPKTGYEVSHTLATGPYNQAMSNWQAAMSREAAGMKLEGTVQAQDIARQRMAGYMVNAKARETAAKATEKFRQYQQEHVPWAPHSEEEAIRQDERRRKAEAKPSTFAEQLDAARNDPAGFEKWSSGMHPRDPERSTIAERDRRAGQVEAGRNARSAAAIAARREPPSASPRDQAAAEVMAAQRLVRRDPKYAPFFKPGGPEVVGGRTVINPGRIITPDELPKAGGGILGMGGVPDAQASLARDKYREFLSELEKEKQRVLGSKGTGGSTWEIRPE